MMKRYVLAFALIAASLAPAAAQADNVCLELGGLLSVPIHKICVPVP